MKKIVVIDDEKHIIEYLQRLFNKHNYNTYIASDGVEGLILIRKIFPDLVIIDLRMPRMSGFQVIDKIKSDSKLNKIPIIVSTAIKDLSTIVKMRKLGVVDYIVKPFFRDEILTRVMKTLDDFKEEVVEDKPEKKENKKEKTIIGDMDVLKRVSIDEVKSGMVLGAPVKHNNKMILLSQGTVITDPIIKKLKNLDIIHIEIIPDN